MSSLLCVFIFCNIDQNGKYEIQSLACWVCATIPHAKARLIPSKRSTTTTHHFYNNNACGSRSTCIFSVFVLSSFTYQETSITGDDHKLLVNSSWQPSWLATHSPTHRHSWTSCSGAWVESYISENYHQPWQLDGSSVKTNSLLEETGMYSESCMHKERCKDYMFNYSHLLFADVFLLQIYLHLSSSNTNNKA